MASLRKRARRDAKIQFRPQLRELNQVKREAKQMLRSNVAGERQAAKGIIAAADRAISGVRKDYRAAGAESRLANRLGGKIGNNTFAQADALSRRQTQRGIAESVAAEVGDLRARMVQARSAQAYSTRAHRGAYQSTVAGIQKQRAGVKADMGAFTLSRLDELRDARAEAQAEAAQQAIDNSLAERRVAASEESLAFRKREARRDRRDGDSGSSPAERVRSQAIKDDIITLRAEYERQINKNVPLAKIAKRARQAGWKRSVMNAASSLATRGYIPPNGIEQLRSVGLTNIPDQWKRAPRTRTGVGGGIGIGRG
jgi:hypothetical protein